jgi:hypothetical protein
MRIADRSHLQRQTVETNLRSEPCKLDRAATRCELLLLYRVQVSAIVLPFLH